MLHKFIKFLFLLIINFLTMMQLVWVVLALVTIVFWIYQIAGSDSLSWANDFFVVIAQITKYFYNPKNSVFNVDFTYFVSAILMGVFAIVNKYVLDFVYIIEDFYNNAHNKVKKHMELNFNKNLEKQFIKNELKNKKLMMIVDFKLDYIVNKKIFSQQEDMNLEQKEFELRREFINYIAKELTFKVSKNDNDDLLLFDDFKFIDKLVENSYVFFKQAQERLHNAKLQLKIFAAVDVYDSPKKQLSVFKKLVKLKYTKIGSKILCFNTFKHRYGLQKKTQHEIISLGTFNIDEENVDVYAIEKLRTISF